MIQIRYSVFCGVNPSLMSIFPFTGYPYMSCSTCRDNHVYHVYMVHDHHWIWRRKCRVCSDFKRDTVHSSYMAEGMYWVVWFAQSLIFTNFRRATMAETTWGMDHQNKSHSGTVMSHAIRGGRFTSIRAALKYKEKRENVWILSKQWGHYEAILVICKSRGGGNNPISNSISSLFCFAGASR